MFDSDRLHCEYLFTNYNCFEYNLIEWFILDVLQILYKYKTILKLAMDKNKDTNIRSNQQSVN